MIFAAGLYTGREIHEMFLIALSLAVAIVPEGLPAVVTITLALGAAAMVRKQALARRLQAVETLGAASVICTDKTGTLTEDKMTATRVATPGGTYSVTGGGYDPAGHIENAQGRPVRVEDDPDLAALLETVLTCNRAHLERDDDDGWRMIGTPTEGALVTLAYKGWCPLPAREPVAELPFSSERKRMSVLSAGEGASAGAWVLHVKGAPERILERCTRYRMGGEDHPLGAADRARFTADWEALAAEGARVIAVARRHQPGATPPADEDDLTWLGAVALMDPPREEVKPAIAAARGAGIRVIMITGDGAATAKAVAGMVGLEVDRVLTGTDVEEFTDAELDAALDENVLFARTAPAHKMRLVRMLQAKGQIVAMTGDGVNDAPALKQSRHRHRHGRARHRRGPRRLRPGPARRQFRHHRARHQGRPAPVRERAQVRALPAVVQRGRGGGAARQHPDRRTADLPRHPDPVDEPHHRRGHGGGAGARKGDARHDEAPAARTRTKA